MQIILKNLAKLIRDNSNGDQVQTQGKVTTMKRRTRKSVLKAAWIGKGGGSEQRWRITDGQDREWVEKVKGIGNVVLNVEAALDQ